MSRSYIAKALREQIATDARHRCGYYLTSARIIGAPMDLDHIIPESLGGPTLRENLWLACSMFRVTARYHEDCDRGSHRRSRPLPHVALDLAASLATTAQPGGFAAASGTLRAGREARSGARLLPTAAARHIQGCRARPASLRPAPSGYLGRGATPVGDLPRYARGNTGGPPMHISSSFTTSCFSPFLSRRPKCCA